MVYTCNRYIPTQQLHISGFQEWDWPLIFDHFIFLPNCFVIINVRILNYGLIHVMCGHFDLWPSKSNQFILESKWMFVPNLKEFSKGFPEIAGFQKWDWPLTFWIWNVITLYFYLIGHLWSFVKLAYEFWNYDLIHVMWDHFDLDLWPPFISF